MTLSMWILSATLVFQAGLPAEQQLLFARILNATGPNTKLQLVAEFEKKYPKSKAIGEVYAIAMGVYQSRNESEEASKFGERALRADPENLEALVTVSRLYAVQGRQLGRAATYARKAIEVIEKTAGRAPPRGYAAGVWREYMVQSKTTAEGTLKYIQDLTNTILGRRRKPPGR
jgi:tetratricopeptide (TPR) repeat protein